MKHKPTSTDALVASKARLVNFAHTYSESNINKSDFYLHCEHLNAFKSMQNNDNMIIFKLDKDTKVVILNKQYYNNKTADILNNTTKIKILEEQRIQHKLLGFYNEHIIPKKIYETIHPARSQRPQLYGLPKIHKQNIPQDQFYQWSALPNIALPSRW